MAICQRNASAGESCGPVRLPSLIGFVSPPSGTCSRASHVPLSTKRRPCVIDIAANGTGSKVMERESMEYDVLIVGAGPAGLAVAVRFKQLCAEHGQDFSICVVEKCSEVGAHILSGAVLEQRALDEMLVNCKA